MWEVADRWCREEGAGKGRKLGTEVPGPVGEVMAVGRADTRVPRE